ncbi:PadR family transcriptional regulator [Curtobacterium sp. MCPF17_002]|uniref:PadR family transcriptional regulator n=1 Tax=Curtobacterium sp. MCPF17_002 TaxID=2175645 RepID=UPI000DA765A9|nr:PadR family transcriptional regulator [Curtobacterium sp. MCPF17_002]WIB78162.1 PadR family transcriptional regulator [Curtobacterium sp. MCPF17_002]
MSPVFAHGHLRLYLLVLLADHPMHGYEVIQALGDRFGGTYVPSAGTVYPRLSKLEDEGLVSKSADGRKTVYAITDAGRAELDARADEIAAVENGVNDSVKTLADGVRASVGEAMRSLRADLAASAQAPRSQTADEPVDVPSEGARALREVEMILSSFRQQVRADLRRRATRGTLTSDTVTRLRDGLEALRKSI